MPGFNIGGTGGGANSVGEVARAHRWRVSIQGGSPQFNRDILLGAFSVQRPGPEIDQVTLHHKQTEMYMPGKHRWGVIDIIFYELVHEEQDSSGRVVRSVNATASEIFKLWGNSVVDLARNNHLNGFKRTIVIDQLSGGGGGRSSLVTTDNLTGTFDEFDVPSIYTYKCIGAWPIRVDPTELNYSSSELSTTKVAFRFDAVEEMSKNVDKESERRIEQLRSGNFTDSLPAISDLA